jgi:DNA polymerase V
VTELPELVEVVSQFASRVADKARQQEAAAGAVNVFIKTSPFRKHDRQHSPSLTVPLLHPSADTWVILGTAVRAIQQMYRPGFNYSKAGVMLVDLQPQGLQQSELDLFGASDGLAMTLQAWRAQSPRA